MTSAPAAPASPPLYLLDTNIVIHYARGRAVGQQIEADYSLLTTANRPLICIVTHGEAMAFAMKRGWGSAKLATLQTLLAEFVAVDINDSQVIDAYARTDAQSQMNGRKMGKNDLWIAATAQVAGATLMSTDADFDHLAAGHLKVIKIDAKTGVTI